MVKSFESIENIFQLVSSSGKKVIFFVDTELFKKTKT